MARRYSQAGRILSVQAYSAVEYVVRGDETKEELETKVKRGITPE